MEKRVEKAKNDMMTSLKVACDLRDKYYEEAERKSKEVCSKLTNDLMNIVKGLSDEDVLELGINILDGSIDGSINKEYVDIILIVLSDRLSKSNNMECSLLGMITIGELAKRALGDKKNE